MDNNRNNDSDSESSESFDSGSESSSSDNNFFLEMRLHRRRGGDIHLNYEDENISDPDSGAHRHRKSSSEDDHHKRNTFLLENLLTGLNELRQEGRFCDITLEAGDIKILAHKNILCAYSPYFNAMFAGHFKEKDDSSVVLDNLEPTTLKMIIDYLYSGDIDLNDNNVQIILETAHFLQIDAAQHLCCTYLSKDVNENNCLEYISIAGKYRNNSLLYTSILMTAKNFHKLYGKEELFNIEFHELKQLLNCDFVRGYPTFFIFNVITKWVEKYPKERLKHLHTLLIAFINPATFYAKDLVTNCKIINESKSCETWLNGFKRSQQRHKNDVILTFNTLVKNSAVRYTLDAEKQVLPRSMALDSNASYVRYHDAIFVHGGWRSKNGYSGDAYIYNIGRQTWKKFIPLRVPRAYHRSCILNDYMYIVGGGFTTNAINAVEAVDLKTGTSLSIDDLINARSLFGIATYANSIYTVAGINAEVNHVSVERFDPREGKWNVLNGRCYGFGTCNSAVVGDVMYCAMGPGKSMERYDFRNNEWTLIINQNNEYPNDLFTIDETLHGVFCDKIAEYNSTEGNWRYYIQMSRGNKSDYWTAIPFKMI